MKFNVLMAGTAVLWLQRLCLGVAEYGTEVNAHKARVNFHVKVEAPGGQALCLPRFDVPSAVAQWDPKYAETASAAPTAAADAGAEGGMWHGLAPLHSLRGRSLPWCGLLLDPTTLQVTADYSRYAPPARISDFVAVPARRQGQHDIPTLLLHFVRPKCHAILLDPAINTLPVQALNVYQMMALGALKLLALLRHHERRGIALPTPSKFPSMVDRGAAAFSQLIKETYHRKCRQQRYKTATGAATTGRGAAPAVVLKGGLEQPRKRQKVEAMHNKESKQLHLRLQEVCSALCLAMRVLSHKEFCPSNHGV